MAGTLDVFAGAVRVLVGAGPIKQRLMDAWRVHLSPVQDKDVPESLRGVLAALRTAMHSAQAAGGLSSAEASVRKMSEKDAAEHALQILDLYAQLAFSESEVDAAPRLRLVNTPATIDAFEELPAFLSRA